MATTSTWLAINRLHTYRAMQWKYTYCRSRGIDNLTENKHLGESTQKKLLTKVSERGRVEVENKEYLRQ